jgi:hypothetical protein
MPKPEDHVPVLDDFYRSRRTAIAVNDALLLFESGRSGYSPRNLSGWAVHLGSAG